jgi:hypothetical protein
LWLVAPGDNALAERPSKWNVGAVAIQVSAYLSIIPGTENLLSLFPLKVKEHSVAL